MVRILGSPSLSIADPLAVANGFLNWSYNPAINGAGVALTSQTIAISSLWLPPGQTISNVYLTTIVAGTSTVPTGFFVGICSATKMLAQSSNLNASASLTTLGVQAFPVSYVTSLADSATGFYYVAILQNGAFAGTNVTFARGNANTPGYGKSSTILWGNIGTSQTALPSNAATITPAAVGVPWWVAVA